MEGNQNRKMETAEYIRLLPKPNRPTNRADPSHAPPIHLVRHPQGPRRARNYKRQRWRHIHHGLSYRRRSSSEEKRLTLSDASPRCSCMSDISCTSLAGTYRIYPTYSLSANQMPQRLEIALIHQWFTETMPTTHCNYRPRKVRGQHTRRRSMIIPHQLWQHTTAPKWEGRYCGRLS